MKFLCAMILMILGAFAPTACFAQDFYGAIGNSTTQIKMVTDWTSVFCFYLAVVYFGASVALMLSRNFSSGLINFGICLIAVALMFVEPTFLNMVSLTGFKYSVKFTIQLSLSAICVMAVLGFLFLPTIIAFAKQSKWRILIVPLNLVGIFVFPLFVLSLYLVQSELNSKIDNSNKTDEEMSSQSKLASTTSSPEASDDDKETSIDRLSGESEDDIEISSKQIEDDSKE